MLLGIDAGTSKTAAVITDLNGNIEAVSSDIHDAYLSAQGDRNEQDPGKILKSVWKSVSGLPANLLSEVSAVGVTGQMHGIVLLDNELKTVSPLITWQDGRCLEEPHFLDSIESRTGFRLSSGYGCATLAWMAAHNSFPAGAVCGSTIQDLIVARLCGLYRPIADTTDAASWGFFDISTLKWNTRAAEEVGIGPEFLPEIVSPGTQVGRVDEAVSKKTGIPVEVPVAAAIGDNQASLLATLKEPDHDLALTLGTGGQISAILSPRRTLVLPGKKDMFEVRPYPGGRTAVVGASLCGGAAWGWLAQSISSWLRDTGAVKIQRDDLFEKMNDLALRADTDISVKPHFSGERYNPALRGSIEGINLQNFTIGNLARGLARGIAEHFLEILPPWAMRDRERIVGSGNALRLNSALRKAVEEVFGLPLVLNEAREEAAAGAAINSANLAE